MQQDKYTINKEGVFTKKPMNLLLFLGILSLQFYLIESGKPQISHITLFLFSIFSIYTYYRPNFIIKNRVYLVFFIYTLYTLIVNGYYSLFSTSNHFAFASLFNIYNFILFISLCLLFENSSSLKKTVIYPSLLALVSLVGFHAIGLGRYIFYPRYNGFFNDPNQMSFWSLCTFSIIAISTKRSSIVVATFILTLWICILSLSRSALIGISTITIGITLRISRDLIKKPLLLLLLILMISTALLYTGFNATELTNNKYISSYIDRASKTDVDQQLEGRGYNLPGKYPEYLLFGAGQGDMIRFNSRVEIHSTWIGILFYYGIPGLCMFIYILFSIQSNLRLSEKLIFLGPLIYGISTYGARSPVFYVFLATVYFINSIKKRSNIQNRLHLHKRTQPFT